jgi:hypothetical protein
MNTPNLIDETPEYLQVTTALAMELASQLSDPREVFSKHGFTKDEALVLLKDEVFGELVKEAQREWRSNTNVGDRIRMKSRMALEELLLPTFKMAQDPRVPPPSRTDAVKLFERLSGVAKVSEDAGGSGPKFILNISVGQESGPKEIIGEVIDSE